MANSGPRPHQVLRSVSANQGRSKIEGAQCRDMWADNPPCSLYVLVRCPSLEVDIRRATCDCQALDTVRAGGREPIGTLAAPG
jgi:hypothetical protein